MTSYFEISYFKRLAKINYILLIIYISISITAHIIANRLSLIDGYPIISAGYIYMACYVLTDVFACFNSRRLVIMLIFLEAVANIIFIIITNIVNSMPYPSFFHHAQAYRTVFSPILVLYFANLIGTFVASVIDLYIFYYLYRIKRWFFTIASLTSSVFTLTLYTYITDYFGFRGSFPLHVWQITNVNVVTNFMTLVIYTLLAQILVFFLNKILNKRT
jgi:uncharacterized PurR-regulated membrane protein YhhQ (DUF165 family)